MLEQYQCEDCFMAFDNPQALASHQDKFCIHSKYADLDSLTQQYDQIKGNPKVKQSYFRPPSNHLELKASQQSYAPDGNDREYRQLLRQIGDRQDLRKKLEREKLSAQQELDVLEKKEKEVFLNARKRQLQDVVKKRQKVIDEEEQLQKEIKQFERQRKEESRVRLLNSDDDFAFRQGREAGKLAMQRRLLEQKKRQIETNLKFKRREQEKLNRQLDKINDQPIFVPQYRKKESAVKKPNYDLRQQTLPSDFPSPKPYQKPQTSIPKPPQNKLYAESIIKPVNLQTSSKKSVTSQVNDDYLKAAFFSGKEKTLFQSLNPKGKSDEDIFIESLVAQQYDALNVLARLPKDSEIYVVKMKQFQEMSRMRQELKDKIQRVRLEKVRKEFEMEKNMTETEKANVEWLDKNRRHMLNREVDILQNQARQQQLDNQMSGYPSPMMPSGTPDMQRRQTTQPPGNLRQSSIPPELPSIDNIPQMRLPTQQGSRGYKITVKSVKGYNNRGAMCVKIVVLEEDTQNGQWVFSTKYHDQAAPKDDRNPYNPTVKNRLDELGDVVFNESFEIRQDLQSRYNNSQNQIYLWLMVMQKDDLKISNQPQLYLWYCFKLTHFGHIREGSFNLSLYHDNFPFPVPTDMNRMKGKANEEILIELSQSQLTEEKKPSEIGSLRNRTGRNVQKTSSGALQGQSAPNKTVLPRPGRKTMVPRTSEPKISSVQNINEQFFIENEKPSEFQEVNEHEKLSFNFSIAGLRTLPSYIGPLKLQVKFIDSRNQDILAPDEILASFGNDMYNPRVDYVKTVSNQQIPSSTVVLVKIIAISTLSYEPGLVGFSYFHLGYNEEGNPLEFDQSKFYLISGLYQLPIYWGNLQHYLTLDQLAFSFPSIPCTSLLLSLNLSTDQPRALPNYSQGLYNTVFFSVDETQYRLFRQQVKRERQKTIDYVQGYYKFKGVNTIDYTEDDLKKLLSQALAFNNQNTTNLFMLEAMAEYNSAFGIRVHLDSMQIPPGQNNYYYFSTVCLFPPAKYYSEDKCDLDFLYRIDLGTSLTSSLVLNHDALFYYPPYDPNTCVIIELNRIRLSSSGSPESGVQTCAFTVLPLFDLEVTVPCANIGFKQILLKEGEFDKRQLQSLQKNSIRYIQLMEGQKKSDFGVVVRVLNGYFQKQLAAVATGGQGKPLRSIFQNSKGFKSAEQAAKKIIEDTYGVELS